MYHSTYRGVTIWRASTGYALRWTAKPADSQRLAADTLAGIRELIREALA